MKRIRDTIHGYISIPDILCHKVIDTKIFQRLRRIEQTSMRILYPCAHHDRFSHSLGVYHLAKLAIDSIESNSQPALQAVTKENLQRITNSFLIASLLHDCGHAPFSHRTEHLYDVKAGLISKVAELYTDKDIQEAITNQGAQPHEYASAYLCLTYFRSVIEEFGADSHLVALMIIGCQYPVEVEPSSDICLSNVFIKLLNGKPIDVDRLDYLLRDRWASGIASFSVDVLKLISSISIHKTESDEFILAYSKNSINAIDSVIDARNHYRLWVFGHQKVVYDDYLLKTSINRLEKLIKTKSCPSPLHEIFNVDRLSGESIKVGQFSVHLPADDDIIYMLKTYQAEIPEFDQWLYRQNHMKPMWKNHIDFFHIFSGVDGDSLLKNGKLSKKARKLEGKYNGEVLFLDVEPKVSYIQDNQLNIIVDNKPVCYNKLTRATRATDVKPNFFMYGFIKNDSSLKENDLIKELKRLS